MTRLIDITGPMILRVMAWRVHERQRCSCLCEAAHGDKGMFCAPGVGPVLVELKTVYSGNTMVPMCGACAAWWRKRSPERVAQFLPW